VPLGCLGDEDPIERFVRRIADPRGLG